jgi:hypothetical protein
MRFISVDLIKCKQNKITPNVYIFLFLSHHKDFDAIEKLFMQYEIINMQKICVLKGFTIDTEGKLLTSKGKQLLQAEKIELNFDEFFNEYPLKAGSRRLKPVSHDTYDYSDLRKRYLSKVKTETEHKIAVEGLIKMVEEHRLTSRMQYLPGLEVVINGRKWERYIDNSDEENSSIIYGQKIE